MRHNYSCRRKLYRGAVLYTGSDQGVVLSPALAALSDEAMSYGGGGGGYFIPVSVTPAPAPAPTLAPAPAPAPVPSLAPAPQTTFLSPPANVLSDEVSTLTQSMQQLFLQPAPQSPLSTFTPQVQQDSLLSGGSVPTETLVTSQGSAGSSPGTSGGSSLSGGGGGVGGGGSVAQGEQAAPKDMAIAALGDKSSMFLSLAVAGAGVLALMFNKK